MTIPDGWKETTLGEIAIITRGASPRPINDYISKDGISWIKIADATKSQDRFIDSTNEFIKQEGSEFSVKIYPGDLILSNSATPGIPKISKIEACIHDGWLLFRKINIDKLFLFYWLKDSLQDFIHSASGTVFKNLKTDIVKNLPILLPPLSEQKEIADILSSFDDKIELLREENKTLEAIAQTIFKEWFVNFNFPNENGKPYKSSGGKMISSELGEIPEGWRVGIFSELVDITTGKGINNKDLVNDGKYSVLGANGEIGKTNKYLYDEDLILTGRVGTLGKVYISKGKTWISDNVLLLIPINNVYFYFAYFFLKMSNIKSLNRGSTQPLITQTDLKNVDLFIPNNDVIKKWKNIAITLFEKIFNNEIQIQSLSSIRNKTLPLFLNGEIRLAK